MQADFARPPATAAVSKVSPPLVAGPQPPTDTTVALSSATPPATGNELNAAETAAQPDAEENGQAAVKHYELPIPQWMFSLIGHVFFALVGLGLGYWLLCWLRPNVFRWPW
jgi:hypothetical protein